jgi:L-amino acid N-acyltransferase YncA
VSSPAVRPATVGDLDAVTAIYAPYVASSVITFETEAPDAAAWRTRFDAVVGRGLPFLVATSGSRVVGYAYAGPWKERAAYRHTVENAIYLAPDARGRGIGVVLLEALLDACAEAGAHQVITVIADGGGSASMRLHVRCGFREAGRLEQVGFKHGRWLDTVLMQSPPASNDPQHSFRAPAARYACRVRVHGSLHTSAHVAELRSRR